ncbi:helix-turn-helix domain-containing protein [Streptomyces caniscabiei]|uniref:Helix-turn-helix domain-containing protein n=2 Tax=Streptomyces caniscabiei TaxID=2746961 RepID=A0A927L3I9_9ACTN|nr:transcriptional regulator [Streptomyces caniscabiei]MBD9724353.1 helix-turn-helix domain-containing protein [Streptomyces caniscabiei]MDX3507758.1 helix-turn-helix domain-containing protein [Streptomyces caniscabiei]MDX3717720.1 helix-turn-helix domain-containing protein [Streptomyces caniscabiei]WEO25463.1 helix-turn-helix domain-containing protein [Streptomyces caniscabiei]
MAAMHDDVAEFALLLTRLKERTDRSYAALGRRLGMNASTLHRYCAGEAVPPDFSGIEQFAALCGASPEERVEVHRRWILAVAARQRSRSSDARRTPAPPRATRSTEPSSSASASPDGRADETPESTLPTAPTGPTEPTVPTEPRPEPTSPSGRGPSPTSPAEARPEPITPSDPRPRPAARADRQPHTGHDRRPGTGHDRRSRRRAARATGLAASLVVALASLTASAAGIPADGRDTSASAPGAPKPSASPTRGDAGPRAANPSSNGGEPSASVPAATDGGGPRKNRTDDDTAAAPRTPLTWTANSYDWATLACEHDYVIAKPPRQVPPPPAPQDNEVWATSLGAVHGRNTPARITVQGRGSAAVVLEALHVRVVNRAPAPAADGAVAYSLGDGCGAGIEPRYFSVDLDARAPLPRAVPAGRPDSPSYAVDFPYRVSLQEPEVLLIDAGTESCTCDWYLELDWSSQGRSGTVRIDDHGRPFRTTAVEGLPHYKYDHSSGWVPVTTAYDDESETGESETGEPETGESQTDKSRTDRSKTDDRHSGPALEGAPPLSAASSAPSAPPAQDPGTTR